MDKESVGVQAMRGLRRAAGTIAAIAIAGLLFVGAAAVFSPSAKQSAVGWACLLVGAVVLALTVDRWIKALPGILGAATFAALITLIYGHFPNRPSIEISRGYALVFTLILASSSMLSFALKSRRLRTPDRLALIVFVLTLAVGAGYDSARVTAMGRPPADQIVSLAALGAGLTCLLVAWAYGRSKNDRLEEGQSS